MPFEIQVRVDPSQAKSAIGDVGKALSGVEAGGTAAGAAVSRGMREGSSSADKLKASAAGLAGELQQLATGAGLGALGAELANQRTMLDQCRVGAHTYLEELERINAAMPKAGPMGPAPGAPGVGGAAAGVGGLDSALAGIVPTIAVATGGLLAMGAAALSAGDHYTELANKVRQFATSMHTADDIVNEQLRLAGQLHASLDATSDLYVKFRRGTADMGLSADQTMRMMKTFGETIEMSGHSLDDASGMMTKLAYAMDSGAITGRELKSMMREFPELANLWTAATGHTQLELEKMANSGKLAVEDLVMAFDKSGAEIDAKFSKHAQTAGGAWQHLKDQMSVTVGKTVADVEEKVGEGASAIQALPEAMIAFAKASNHAIPTPVWIGVYRDETANLFNDLIHGQATLQDTAAAAGALDERWKMFHGADPVKQFTSALDGMIAGMRELSTVGTDATKFLDAFTTKTDAAVAKVHGLELALAMSTIQGGIGSGEQIARTSALYRQLQDAQLDVTRQTEFGGGVIADVTKKHLEHTRALQDVNAAFHAGKITATDYYEKLKEINGGNAGGLSEAEKLYQSITAPMKEYNAQLGAANELFQSGRISAAQYQAELVKLASTRPPEAGAGPASWQDYAAMAKSGALDAYENLGPHAVDPGAALRKGGLTGAYTMPSISAGPLPDAGVPKLGDFAKEQEQAFRPGADYMQAQDAALKKLNESMKQFESPAEKYLAEQKAINDFTAAYPAVAFDAAHALDEVRAKYMPGQTEAEKYGKALADMNQLIAATGADAAHATKALDDLRAQFDHSFGQGITNGLKAIKTETLNVASTVSTAMTNAFNGVNEQLANLVVDGKADWHSLVSGIEKDAIKIALQVIEGSVMQDLGIVAAMTTGGAAAGAEIAAAMVAAGAASAATSGVSTAIMDAAGAALFFAGGGSFIAGGDGGTDTTFLPMHVTRGERVTVETPSQQAARDGRGGGGQPVVHVKHIVVANHAEAMKEWAKSRDGEIATITHVANNRKKLGL